MTTHLLFDVYPSESEAGRADGPAASGFDPDQRV
jgi:hypothetical protein